MSLVLARSLDVVAELPLANEILYIILEFVTIVGVMSHVTVIATIFFLVHLYSLLSYWEREVDPPFISLKHLRSISI